MSPIVKIVLLMILVAKLSAQHKVTFNLTDNSALQHDSIYLSGSFNEWNTEANENYLLKPLDVKRKSITISLPKGEIQYKYHRGSWSTVEKTFFGDEVANRVIFISKDTMLNDSAASWLDDFIADKHIAISNATHDSSLL